MSSCLASVPAPTATAETLNVGRLASYAAWRLSAADDLAGRQPVRWVVAPVPADRRAIAPDVGAHVLVPREARGIRLAEPWRRGVGYRHGRAGTASVAVAQPRGELRVD